MLNHMRSTFIRMNFNISNIAISGHFCIEFGNNIYWQNECEIIKNFAIFATLDIYQLINS